MANPDPLVFADIRWMACEIEQLAIGKYMGCYDNQAKIFERLKIAVNLLYELPDRCPGDHGNGDPGDCVYPFVRCKDGSCAGVCAGGQLDAMTRAAAMLGRPASAKRSEKKK
jgi:hypothetical protein